MTGYFRPVAAWNKGKKEEFAERKVYKVVCAFFALATLLLAGCGHNAIAYGDGVMLETTINPESYAFGVSFRYGKILTVCCRENVELEMQGAASGKAASGSEASTGADNTGEVKFKIGRQITGYYVDAIKWGATPEQLDKYTAPEAATSEKSSGDSAKK